MRRRTAVGAGLLALLALLAWWVGSSTSEPVAAVAEAPASRVLERFTNAEVPLRDDSDGLWRDAAAGDLGEEMQGRVCELCRNGMIDPEACELCTPDEPGGGLLVVDVVDEGGRPAERARVFVRHCEHEQQGWREYVIEGGRCTVWAGRRDGALWAQAEPIELTVPEGSEEYVQLELPSTRTGGLGVSVRGDSNGVRVVAVMPNTPAAKMGLEVGDLIVEVDGQDTTQIDLPEFIRTMTGPEDTEVDFVVQFQTDTGIAEEAVTIVRQYLEPSG